MPSRSREINAKDVFSIDDFLKDPDESEDDDDEQEESENGSEDDNEDLQDEIENEPNTPKRTHPSFWDSEDQYVRARKYSNYHKLKLRDEHTRNLIKELLLLRTKIEDLEFRKAPKKDEIKTPSEITQEIDVKDQLFQLKDQEAKLNSRITGKPIKFRWDSPEQEQKAYRKAKKFGLDVHDEKNKYTLRSMMRLQDKNALIEQKKQDSQREAKKVKKIQETLTLVEQGVVTPNHIDASTQYGRVVRDIFNEEFTDDAFKNGPLPTPTGYDSRDGTQWKDADLKTERINYRLINGRQEILPIFENDIEWIEFFLGDSLLRPKKKAVMEELTRLGLVGKLYPIQNQLSEFLDENPWGKFEVYRGVGKTVIAIGKLLRKMCDNPNECFFFQSETEVKTINRIRTIKKELQTNQKIIAFYGYLPADSNATGNRIKSLGKDYRGKWAEGMLELKRDYSGIEPTLMGISWQTGLGVGFHYTGGILDDPWSVKNQNTNGASEKYWEWWSEFYGSLEDADFCWVLCTKKGLHDIYEEMDIRKIFATFKRKLVLKWPQKVKYIEKNGAIVDVEILDEDYETTRYVEDDCYGKYTIKNCLLILKDIGKAAFEREYQNNPIRDDGILFNYGKIRFCDPKSIDEYARLPYQHDKMWRGIVMYDPAFGLTSEASYNALVAMAQYHRRIYLLHAWIGHWSKPERITAFTEARELFPGFPFYCEDVRQQLNVIRDLTAETGIILRPFSPKIKNAQSRELFVQTSNPAKKAKIYDALEPIIEDGRFYVMPNLPFLDEFEDEVKNFPNNLKDDFVDAISMACMVIDPSRIVAGALTSGYATLHSPIKGGTIATEFTIGNKSNYR